MRVTGVVPAMSAKKAVTVSVKKVANGGKKAATKKAAKREVPTFPLAYVKYHDHCWLEAKELEKINAATPYIVEESGFLIVDNEKYITLAKERSTDGEKGKVQYDDVTIIMRSDILDMRVFQLEPVAQARASTVSRRAR